MWYKPHNNTFRQQNPDELALYNACCLSDVLELQLLELLFPNNLEKFCDTKGKADIKLLITSFLLEFSLIRNQSKSKEKLHVTSMKVMDIKLRSAEADFQISFNLIILHIPIAVIAFLLLLSQCLKSIILNMMSNMMRSKILGRSAFAFLRNHNLKDLQMRYNLIQESKPLISFLLLQQVTKCSETNKAIFYNTTFHFPSVTRFESADILCIFIKLIVSYSHLIDI